MEEKEFIINKIIEKVVEKLSKEDKVVIFLEDIIGEYGVSYTTAYTIIAMLKARIQKEFGEEIGVFRRRGKLIIFRK
jgi:hypothetical protein